MNQSTKPEDNKRHTFSQLERSATTGYLNALN